MIPYPYISVLPSKKALRHSFIFIPFPFNLPQHKVKGAYMTDWKRMEWTHFLIKARTHTYLQQCTFPNLLTSSLSNSSKESAMRKNIVYQLSAKMMMIIMCRDCDSFRFLPSLTLHFYLYISNEENCIFGSFLQEKISLSHLLASHMPQKYYASQSHTFFHAPLAKMYTYLSNIFILHHLFHHLFLHIFPLTQSNNISCCIFHCSCLAVFTYCSFTQSHLSFSFTFYQPKKPSIYLLYIASPPEKNI